MEWLESRAIESERSENVESDVLRRSETEIERLREELRDERAEMARVRATEEMSAARESELRERVARQTEEIERMERELAEAREVDEKLREYDSYVDRMLALKAQYESKIEMLRRQLVQERENKPISIEESDLGEIDMRTGREIPPMRRKGERPLPPKTERDPSDWLEPLDI